MTRPAAPTDTRWGDDDEAQEHLYLYTNGCRFHVVTQGRGPLVLLVHGFPEAWFSWRHQLPVIAGAGYRAVAVDMRGYGRSSKPLEVDAYRLIELVEDCVGIVHALGERTAAVIGHDWGATVAWTCAWTRPDVFRAVMAISVAFGGRGQTLFAGVSSLGEVRPSEAHRILAGPDKQFYTQNWTDGEGLAAEAEPDMRSFLRDLMFGFSADALAGGPPPPEMLGTAPADVLAMTRAGNAVVPTGTRTRDLLVPAPDPLPAWLAEDLDDYVAEFEHTGLRAPLNWYRNADRNWEDLEEFAGRRVEVPSFFLGSDHDLGVLWGAESIARFPETMSRHIETHIIERCGHYVQREAPRRTNAAVLRFLDAADGAG